jgi:autotransporter passenger strand-loop-strand repeat protein
MVESGGLLEVERGTANNTIVGNGGEEIVGETGIVNIVTVESGGLLVVGNGTIAGATVNSGGTLELLQGAGVFGTITVGSGGTLELSQGVYVSPSGTINLNSGAIFEGTLELSGTASGITVNSGLLAVENGGSASGTTVNSGGLEVVSAGGNDTGAQIRGGEQDVYGSATNATIFTGSQVVESGGNASGTTINNGGVEDVFSGGTTSGAIVNGGVEVVSAGGTDNGAQINGGGEQDVYGTAIGTTINAGGRENVYGTATNTTINSGALEDVLSGGIASGTTISGGTLELTNGGSAGGAITFAGSGGVLKIDGTTMPTNVISGFATGDKLDLAGVAYSSTGTVTLTSGNVLKIVEGGTTYNLQLNPSQNYSEDAFALSSDGAGDTDVTVSVPSGAETTEPPHLTVSGSLSVHPGGSIPMGITATPVDSDDTVSITIKGVPSYEKITAGPGETVATNTAKGLTTYTITSTTPGAAITDLTLTSTYNKNKVVKNTFTVTASNTTSGETATSLSKTVTVTDPPILATNQTNSAPPSGPPSLDHVVALFNQSIAAAFSDQQQHGMLNTNPLSQVVTNEQQFLAHPTTDDRFKDIIQQARAPRNF